MRRGDDAGTRFVPSIGLMREIQPRLTAAPSIRIGEIELTPAASHLFALLLVLVLSPKGSWTRRALQELLFVESDERTASHRLRQLLYRLRSFGVELDEDRAGVLRVKNPVADPLADEPDPADTPTGVASDYACRALAHYAPRMPAPFLDWLERKRETLQRTLVARRMARLRAAREAQDWTSCLRLATALLEDEPCSEELVVTAAEAYAMLGRRDDAIASIDTFVRENELSLDANPQLRKLRARILSTRLARRQGTLRGREECLAFLGEQWELALHAPGARACAILGAPGMGKTRIGETVAASTRLDGGQVLQHRCDEQARRAPLGLFAALVPELRKRRGSIGADPSLRAVLDRVASDTAPSPIEGEPGDRRAEVKRAVIDLLEAVTSEQPMLLVVDDAHLLDDPSRAVIHTLAQMTNAAQLLVLLLSRPRPEGHRLLVSSPRFATYTLPPLGESDSRALLLEVAHDRHPSEAELAWAIGHAEGNPFYLHALAQHACEAGSLPAHIRSLAATSYLALSADARTVLDTSLLLDTLASPARVAQVSELGGRALVAALRELEDADLLRFGDGVFVRPHALMCEALDELMSSAARAVLQHRIAVSLSAECANPVQARVVAWPAVSAWLAAGEATAAVELALGVARHAEAVGEPEAGAVLLAQIARDTLPSDVQRRVLDEIIRLAHAGKCLLLLCSTLKERIALAHRCFEGSAAIANFTLRSIAADQTAGLPADIGSARSFMLDRSLQPHLRAEAAARELADADLHFDEGRGKAAIELLLADSTETDRETPAFIRAELLYHTAFGDPRIARNLATKLLELFPYSSVSEDGKRSRFYATLSLMRCALDEDSERTALASWNFLRRGDQLLDAIHFGVMALESRLRRGNYSGARDLLTQIEEMTHRRSATEPLQPVSRCVPATLLAIQAGDLDQAEQQLRKLLDDHPDFGAPRRRIIWLAMSIRLSQLKYGSVSSASETAELADLFERGRRYGDQDLAAAVLWHEHMSRGDAARASQLLRRYLLDRRELGSPEAMLQEITALDPVWRDDKTHTSFHSVTAA